MVFHWFFQKSSSEDGLPREHRNPTIVGNCLIIGENGADNSDQRCPTIGHWAQPRQTCVQRFWNLHQHQRVAERPRPEQLLPQQRCSSMSNGLFFGLLSSYCSKPQSRTIRHCEVFVLSFAACLSVCFIDVCRVFNSKDR